MSMLKDTPPAVVSEVDNSLDDRTMRVRSAWYRQFEDTYTYTWVVDVFEDTIVVCANEKHFRVGYTDADETVTFNDPDTWERVTITYQPYNATAEPDMTDDQPAEPTDDDAMTEAVTESLRGVIEANGKITEAVIVVEGVSANKNQYTAQALESGVRVFSGSKMYVDHPTKIEESQRPERSVRDVVGILGEAYVGTDKHGHTALRAPLTISESESWLTTKINEGIIDGLSIRASGKGKRDGDVFVVEAFIESPHTSVDFVTVPAAGGYVDLNESARPEADTDDEPVQESNQEIVELREAHDRLIEENNRLFKQVRESEAATALGALIPPTLPEVARQRIGQQATPIIEAYATHGSTQTAADLREALQEIVEAERAYIAQLVPNGAVFGLQPPTEQPNIETLLNEAFDFLPDAQRKIAVKGRS